MPFRTIGTLLAILVGGLTALVVVLLLMVSGAFADTWWDVHYFQAGQPTGTFYGDGAYIFVYEPATGRTVVGVHDGSWVRLGYLGDIALPAGLGPISFPTGTNEAVAVPGLFGGGGGGGGGVVSAPELAILRRVTKRVGGQHLARVLNPPLQFVTAWGAAHLLNAPRKGYRIILPSTTLEVVEWCSGLTLMKWLLVLAGLILVIVRPPWQAALALLLVVPVIALEVNILRVFAIGLGYEWGYGWAVKEWMGWAATVLGVAQVAAGGWWTRR